MRHDVRRRSLCHRRRIGRRARGAHRGRPRREGDGRRGIPHRRHLRHPRLRAEEAAGLRQPLRRRFRATPQASAGASARRASIGRRSSRPRRSEITRLSGAYRANLEGAGVELDRAARRRRRRPSRAARRRPRDHRARHILIATGARPAAAAAASKASNTRSPRTRFSICRLSRAGCWSSAAAISRSNSPRCSRGSAPRSSRSMRADNVLRGFDEDMRVGLRDEMTRAGVEVRDSAACRPGSTRPATALACRSRRRRNGRASIRFSSPPAARPTPRGLGLEAAGVALDAAGAVIVDADSTTNVPSIHAVGDVTNRINLTPVAIREGHALADRLFGGGAARVDHDERRQRGVHHAGNRRGRPDRARGASSASRSSTSTRPISGR